jgi:cell shape-determining protein MreC
VAILRSKVLFYGLMGVSFLTAFVLPAVFPAKFGSVGIPQLQGIFAPVSRPLRAMAGWVYNRAHRPVVVDDRSPDVLRPATTVYEENHQLLTALASLQIKLDQLSQLNADRQSVGDIRPLCKPATVTGSEVSGLREGLTLSVGSTSLPLLNRPVIRGNPSQSPLPCDLVGRIVRSGPAGAQVRLITDPGFVLTARIGRYVTLPDGKLQMVYDSQIHPLVRGIGSNQMAIQSTLSMQQVRDGKIQKGDTVVLDDHDDWPPNVQGFSVGRIISINPQQNAPLFADIRIEPQTNLMRLTDVMVMVRD